MKIDDVGECWGDDLTPIYDRPTWVKCQKRTNHSVTIIAENDVEKSTTDNCVGMSVLVGDFDKFQVE